jgi:hypothetical protein
VSLIRVNPQLARHIPAAAGRRLVHLRFVCFNLCAFASLADVAKGGDGAKSALREIFCLYLCSFAVFFFALFVPFCGYSQWP